MNGTTSETRVTVRGRDDIDLTGMSLEQIAHALLFHAVNEGGAAAKVWTREGSPDVVAIGFFYDLRGGNVGIGFTCHNYDFEETDPELVRALYDALAWYNEMYHGVHAVRRLWDGAWY